MHFKRKVKPEPNSSGVFFFSYRHILAGTHERITLVQTLFDIFQNTKEVLCKYDYYIYTSENMLHLTNSELKIPHLMGMQYIGRKNQFTGDYGAYSIKKKRITLSSIEKLVKSIHKKGIYHCNSFTATYQSDREKDLFFCHLSKRHEIKKIIREDKQSKEKEIVYLRG